MWVADCVVPLQAYGHHQEHGCGHRHVAHAVSPGGHRHQVQAVGEEDLEHSHAVGEKHQEVGTAEGDQQLVEHVGSHAPETCSVFFVTLCHSGCYLCKSVMMLSRLPRTPRMVVTRVIHPDTTTLVYSSIIWLLESVLSLKCATPHFVSTYSSYKAFSTDSLIDAYTVTF